MSDTVVLVEAQSDRRPAKRKQGQRGPDLTDADRVDIIRWHLQGLTQEQIAAKLTPVRAQSTISDALRDLGVDTTAEAKHIFRARAASMALRISEEGRPADLVQVQKGLGVLNEGLSAGVTINIGVSSAQVDIGLLSPHAKLGQGETKQIS